MAKSVDPDQNAPFEAVWSGSALFAYAYALSETLVYEILGNLQNQQIVIFKFKFYVKQCKELRHLNTYGKYRWHLIWNSKGIPDWSNITSTFYT